VLPDLPVWKSDLALARPFLGAAGTVGECSVIDPFLEDLDVYESGLFDEGFLFFGREHGCSVLDLKATIFLGKLASIHF
jgi:hypothetical protein